MMITNWNLPNMSTGNGVLTDCGRMARDWAVNEWLFCVLDGGRGNSVGCKIMSLHLTD